MMSRALTLTLLLFSLLSFGSASAQQGAVDAQKRVIASIEKQIAEGEKSIAAIRSDKSAVQSRVQSLATQVEQRNRLLGAQQLQIRLLSADIDTMAVRTTTLGRELTVQKETYANMVREAYRNYQHNNFVSYIFASEDFQDVARRIVNIRRVAQLRRDRIETIDSLTTSLNVSRMLLLERKASLDSTVVDITRQKAKIQQDIDAARKQINSLSTRERSELQAKALQQQKLDSAIDELRKIVKNNTQGASFNAKTSNLNLPVKGGRVKRYMDNMAEVVGPEGAGVVAIYEGKVVDVKQNRITGKFDIYIAHGEYITSYAGLKTSWVKKDESVKRNQTIGVVGAAVDILTMESEHKIIFGIYPPSPTQKMKASDCFKK